MKILKHIPNALTLSNLGLGVLSIVCSMNHEVLWASTFIALATIPDFLDGLVARLLQVSSDVGKDLDSLADLVSFGVAPSHNDFQSANAIQYRMDSIRVFNHPYFLLHFGWPSTTMMSDKASSFMVLLQQLRHFG